MSDFDWTNERIAELKRLDNLGISYTEIGKIMKLSRCAISGKVRRLGLPLRKNAAWFDRPKKRKQATPKPAKSKGEPMPQPEPKAAPTPFRAPVKLAEAEFYHCRFPAEVFAWPDFWICGERKQLGRTYCREHCRVVFQAPQKRNAA